MKKTLRFMLYVAAVALMSCQQEEIEPNNPSNNALPEGNLNPNLNDGTVTDQDGNQYPTIVIGDQEWMAENLRTTTYANGDPIPNVTGNGQWSDLITGAWAHYNNDGQYEDPYGKLYNWYAVFDSRNVCPSGWHVPTDGEYTILTNYLGGQLVAGHKMKTTGTEYWIGPNYASNASGFSALPGGSRNLDGGFNYLSTNTTFWCSTADPSWHMSNAWARTLGYAYGEVVRQPTSKKRGHSVRCVKNQGNLALISTSTIVYNSSSTANSGGNVIDDGGSTVTQRGAVWSTSPNPTTANNFTNSGTGTGSFTSVLTGLTDNATYFVRAYAINGAGTAYGNELSYTATATGFEVNPGDGVTFNGYTYASILFGNGQEWMAENLRTTTYANGDPIPNVTDNGQWSDLTTGAWAHYNNDGQYEDPFGKLYNWHAVVDSRNVCPTGWHVPSDAEWSMFINYLDPNANGGANFLNTAGGQMKITGTQYWLSPNTGATNVSGFSGLPGGYRLVQGSFPSPFGVRGNWWSSTEFNTGNARWRYLYYLEGGVRRGNTGKESGLSVRCLRD